MMIRTANQQRAVIQAGGYPRFVEQQIAWRWPGAPAANWQARGEIHAEIARSNWRVCCTTCREAIVIEPGLPFFCPNCLMQANGGYAMRVIWPAERAQIEAVLLARPVPEHRNWLPGETVAMLIAENLAHGLPPGLITATLWNTGPTTSRPEGD